MSLTEYLEKQRQAQTDVGEASRVENEMLGVPPAPAMSPPSSDKPTEPGVLLRLWNRKLWVFPWSYFIEAEFIPQSADNARDNVAGQIRMVFGSREVTLCGRNLAALMESIMRHRVIELREVPEKFLDANQSDMEPVVVRMEITARAK